MPRGAEKPARRWLVGEGCSRARAQPDLAAAGRMPDPTSRRDKVAAASMTTCSTPAPRHTGCSAEVAGPPERSATEPPARPGSVRDRDLHRWPLTACALFHGGNVERCRPSQGRGIRGTGRARNHPSRSAASNASKASSRVEACSGIRAQGCLWIDHMMGDVIARQSPAPACSIDCRPLIIEFRFAVMRTEGNDSIAQILTALRSLRSPRPKRRAAEL